ncbi:hypothetical protein CAPTEDRAFT_152338 [Capitella teleta]|uniref:DUF1989 domain-containing protein n=1 Tax=Capitella teleta TaxID=283909 RepID=R7TDF6_CAPTE|nr:hypothetical protein CAPTEDRAFT_152338 [Capitella teleta]|eukprot:ELT91537.1 hypothetical protein CAPTEDRAFT_152338 [Capitella teleta]
MSDRTFAPRSAKRCYVRPKDADVDRELYERLSLSGWNNVLKKLTVPARGGLAWELKAGQTCRIVTAYGPQVGDLNIWNLHDFRERFYSGKTRAIHRGHLTTSDRLWSSFPYLRPLATITQDSLHQYGVDEDGCGLHDVIGTRCDPYTHKLMTGQMGKITCHNNLIKAVKPWNLHESDIHDVFNVFMCTGIDKHTHDYVIKGSPAQKGDYIELLAETDLLVALSACPQGDCSSPCGQPVPESSCFPLDVYVGQPDQDLSQEWIRSKF